MPAPELASLSFRGEWRRYQQLALDAFERDRAAGKRRTHIVAPPGSGKTLLGVEIVRRLGERALVLVPNSAIQAQWPEAAAKFAGGAGVVAADPTAPVACLTYQAFAQLDDPGAALARLAERRWVAERAAATGDVPERVEADARAWTGAASARRAGDLARITASIKREIARGELAGVDLADLLSPTARQRIGDLHGVGTIVLDECHHLASLWGYVVRTLLTELGGAYVVGLTATPPDALTTEESELYAELLGPVDFTVPTPAVVRDGYLAPYQELAWLTRPLESEEQWLREHDLRFQELVTRLHDDEEGPLSFPAWVLTRLRERARSERDHGEVSWAGFQRANPSLARAGVRFLASAGLALPPGVPRGEGYREQPDLDDWVALLEDYALRRLRADPAPAAAARYDAIAAALRDLGFQLTRRGVRRGASEVDRLLTSSGAKALGLVEVVACEADARGDALRALVLVDAELERRQTSEELVGVLDAAAGTAPGVLRALADDLRTAPLRPLLVSGRGLRCAPRDADALIAALAIDGVRAQPEHGLVQLVGSGPGWQPRTWVAAATRAFERGSTQVLVGTRALLGEGWDALCVNVLVDLSAATTGVSVQQMRGRSLRLDPADLEKIASNWDVVCLAPGLARGTADYERFVRKHLHLFAPSEDGEIEAGPSHVHPALSPFAPPPPSAFDELNRTQAARAAAHAEARRRWRIGEPYSAEVLQTLVVRPQREAAAARASESPPEYPVDQRGPFAAGAAVAVASAAIAVSAHTPELLAGLAAAPVALAWAAARLRASRDRLPNVPPLELVARAVADAYVELGELSRKAAASLAIEPRASGYLRCFLRDASPDESVRYAAALDEALSVADAPRYLVTRLVPDPRRSALALLGRTLLLRPPFARRLSPVPDDLGRTRARAETYARAWRRWLGPSELVFAQRTEAGREARAEAAAAAEEWETQRREVWT
ncbi:MAG TPA: DEAD/DEAH box helicase family protein [Gaiellaceae bacterium]